MPADIAEFLAPPSTMAIPVTVGMVRKPHAGKGVDADDADVGKDAVRRHESQPVMIDGDHAAEYGASSPHLGPIRRVSHHLAELFPLRIESRKVPLETVVRFVPQFEIVKGIAILSDDAVDEVRVVEQAARRRVA